MVPLARYTAVFFKMPFSSILILRLLDVSSHIIHDERLPCTSIYSPELYSEPDFLHQGEYIPTGLSLGLSSRWQ